MFKIYLSYIFFCMKILFNLHHYKSFLDMDGSKAKNHKITLRNIDQKIKFAKKRGKDPKKEHVFLSMFYESLKEEDPKARQLEFQTLFCTLFFWHYSLSAEKKEIPDTEE